MTTPIRFSTSAPAHLPELTPGQTFRLDSTGLSWRGRHYTFVEVPAERVAFAEGVRRLGSIADEMGRTLAGLDKASTSLRDRARNLEAVAEKAATPLYVFGADPAAKGGERTYMTQFGDYYDGPEVERERARKTSGVPGWDFRDDATWARACRPLRSGDRIIPGGARKVILTESPRGAVHAIPQEVPLPLKMIESYGRALQQGDRVRGRLGLHGPATPENLAETIRRLLAAAEGAEKILAIMEPSPAQRAGLDALAGRA